ncbi:unnamed protein product [Urochloa humidicola]
MWLRKYFTLYEQQNARASCTDSSTSHSMSSNNIMGSLVMISQSQKSEIDLYLEEESEPNIEEFDFDILSWWRSKASKFPVLSKMAREFLAIRLSTVSSEAAFSLGGRILGDHRNSLTTIILEALVCTKD